MSLSRYLLLLACLVSASLFATELPSMQQVEEEISRLGSLPESDPAVVKQYQTLAETLAASADKQPQLDELRKLLEQYPQRKAALQQQLEELNQTTDVELPDLPTVNAIEQELATVRARIDEWNQQLLDFEQQDKQLLADQEQLPVAIAEQERALESSQQEVDQEPAQPDADPVTRWLIEARHQFNQLNLEWLQLSQETLVQRRELGLIGSQVIKRRLALAADQIDLLQEKLRQVQAETSRQRTEQAEAISRELSYAPQIIQQWNASNEALTKESAQLTQELLARQKALLELEKKRQQLLQNLSQIRTNIDWLKLSPAFSESLRAILADLPELPSRSGLANRIATAHLKRYELNRELEKLDNINELAKQLAEEHELRPDEQAILVDVLNFRLAELNELLQNNDRLITELTRLEAVIQQFGVELDQEREFLREQQLWIRGRAALWTQLHPSIANWLGTDDLPADLANLGTEISDYLHSLSILGVVFLLALWGWQRLSKIETIWRVEFARVIGQVRRDHFRHTLLLIAITAVAAILFPLWLIALNTWMATSLPAYYTDDLQQLFYLMATVVFVWEAGLFLSRDKGVMQAHLNWPTELTAWLHGLLLRQRWIIYLLLISLIASEILSSEQESILLRVLHILLMVWLLVFLARLLKVRRIPALVTALQNRQLVQQAIRFLILLPLLAMIGLQIWGYYYVAWVILIYHQLTLLAIFSTLLLFQLGVRWLELEQRQLALQRALARREEMLERREQGEEAPDHELDESQLPVEEVSEQSMALLRVGIVVFLITMLSAIWADGLVVYQWMEDITIWEVRSPTETGVELQAITLREALVAVLVVLLTFFAAHNLPGLLELLVLRRMEISPGAAYATTTLLRYSLVLTGVIVGFSILGFHWSKLQWLVAALGVGLGFGLQEIFANLVSGIILLFERPVRVGDTITINDLTGTVTRINTRATTIVDWDRKEIIVPNKALITDQLVNWSLTDAVTRVVVPVGVAYGSEIEQVEQLLTQIAEEQPEVLADPPPQVFFLSFGASSLDFEMRVFLSRVELRMPVTHALLTRIDRLFREHSIEIAFPQLDLHVRDLPKAQETSSGEGS